MNFRKLICRILSCERYSPDCQELVSSAQELIKAECEKRVKSILKEKKAEISKLRDSIKLWRKRYNEEKAIPKRPSYCNIERCPFNPNNKKNSKLTARGNQICYEDGGTMPIKLIGVYRWEALWRETGEHNCQWNWGKYSLAWYEEELSKYDFNYVRHGGILDTKFLYDHCKRMREQRKIVQITVFRNVDEGVLVRLEDMPDLAKLGNVFFDINEFCRSSLEKGRQDIRKAIEIINYLVGNGCIVSAGSWGASRYGRQLCQEFHDRCNKHQIEQHHREWTRESFKAQLIYKKPVIFDEYFAMKSQMSFSKVRELAELVLELGYAGVGYYGFRFPGIPGLRQYDPFDYRKPLEFFELLCKKYN